MSDKNYHCCATCRHFEIGRVNGQIEARCKRLGYKTQPHYQFHCWNPRDDIRLKMQQAKGAALPDDVDES